jgi:hypothetical protein
MGGRGVRGQRMGVRGFDDGVELGGGALMIGVWCCLSLDLSILRL